MAIVLFVSEGAKWVQQDEKRLAAFKQAAKREGRAGRAALGHGLQGGQVHRRVASPFSAAATAGRTASTRCLETDVTPDPKHPVAVGLSPFRIKDEFYYRLKFVKPEGSVKPVLTAKIDGECGTGRVDLGAARRRAVVRVQRPALPRELEAARSIAGWSVRACCGHSA